MSDEIRLQGLCVAPSVLDTIVTLAVKGVEGVVFASSGQGIGGLVNRASGKAVEFQVTDESAVTVTVHIKVEYGVALRDVARNVQVAVADAISSQVGSPVEAVNVYVDGIEFPA